MIRNISFLVKFVILLFLVFKFSSIVLSLFIILGSELIIKELAKVHKYFKGSLYAKNL